MSKETEIAWAAGFFDGEGCHARVNDRGNTYIRLIINQRQKETLERFNNAINNLGTIRFRKKVGGILEENAIKNNPYYETGIYTLTIQSVPKVLEAYNILKPYLSQFKIKQAEDIIKDLTYTGGNFAKTHCPKGHEYNEDNTEIITDKNTGKQRRNCRTCKKESNKKSKAKKKLVEAYCASS